MIARTKEYKEKLDKLIEEMWITSRSLDESLKYMIETKDVIFFSELSSRLKVCSIELQRGVHRIEVIEE